jgi:hypothetical protein
MLNFPSFFNAQVGGYEIEQSLRFDRASSHYLNKTFAANQNTWTVSFWVKRANLNGVVQCLFGTSTNGFYNDLGFEGSDRLRFRQVYSGVPSENFEMVSTMRFRDPSAWYHIVLSYGAHDGSAAADRAKIWVNNQRLTAFDTANYPGANVSSLLNANTRVHNIGKVGYYDDYLGAYIAEFNFIDGQRLDPTDFGEEDDNGVWRPIKYTGTYGNNNSVYLKFDPSATNGVGHDHSGNGNNFTPSGFTTSGTGTDVMSDTPTTNWCTLNSVDPVADTLSEGNLKQTGVNNWLTRRGTIAMTSGKWYWEVTPTFPNGQYVIDGVVNASANLGGHVGQDANGWGFETYTPAIVNNSSYTTYGTSPTSGTVLGFAFDADTGKMWVRNASGFFNSGDPAAGTNPAMTAGAGEYYAAVSLYPTTNTNTANFGQRAFAYTPPTGFKALNTANLPAPTVKDGGKYFDAKLVTTTGSSQNVTGLNFQPDLVWQKSRNDTYSHILEDAVRGAGKRLSSDQTVAEDSLGVITSFNTDGFTSNYSGWGTAPKNWVAWCWDAGGTGSSNTDGSITSTVSANPTAGFSIVSYTGTGTGSDTVGHGLGVAPKIVILKDRDNAENWPFYHTLVDGSLDYMHLNLTDANANSAWNVPTSTVFSASGIAGSGDDCIAYCFNEVEGYSKFGSYTGNGSTDGVFIYTGFKVGWWLVKRIDATEYWYIRDTTRDDTNPISAALHPNAADAEGSYGSFDFLSNGVKIRESGTGSNTSGGTYIYMAFAEHPFGGDGVSPATAR